METFFTLERGPARTRLAKWPEPVAIRLDPALEAYRPDLARYLAELRRRGGVDVGLAREGAQGVIHVRVAPTFDMMRRLGGALCVAAPGDVDWPAFKALIDADGVGPDWATITRPTAATVFVPDRARPYQVRGCLFEEIMQALGPAGDFFALPYSMFNDDGAHHRPTAFDFLALRTLYGPRLRAGMTKAAVLAALGAGPSAAPFKPSALWLKQLRGARAQRHPSFALSGYQKALALAVARDGAESPRALFTAYEAARLRARFEPSAARAALLALRPRHLAAYGAGDPRAALIDLDLAESLLGDGDFLNASKRAAAALPVALGHALDASIARGFMILSAAKRRERRIHSAARYPEAEAEGWRLYAYGAPTGVARPETRPREADPLVAGPPERPERSTAALLVAAFAVLAAFLGCGWLVWRVLAARPEA